MDTPKTITHLGLCAGYGGIELGLHRVLGNLRTVALCEIEAFACANLVAKMEAGLMDCAPIWTDLKTFPWAEFRDRVDILTGGYPCQPFSAAGKRLGTEDPRHLWPFIASGIRILRPKLCYFENVEGHISLGLREVIGELESIGYQTAWGIFSASETGAPHQRKRVFILAYDQQQGLEGLSEFCPSLCRSNKRSFIGNGCSREELANDSSAGLQGNFSGLFNAQGRKKQSRSTGRRSGLGGEIELANSNGARGWEDRESSESWAACTEQPSSDSRGGESGQIREGQAWPSQLADAGRIQPQGWGDFAEGQQSGAGRIPRGEPAPRHDQVWPSRPGEPQHEWEPPRVVADSKRSERRTDNIRLIRQGDEEAGALGACSRAMGNASSERPGTLGAESAGQQRQASTSSTGDAMGNASERENYGRESRDLGQAAGEGRCGDDAVDGAGEGMGNADYGRLASGINAGSGTEADRGGQGDFEQADGGTMGNPECLRISTAREHGAMEQASGIPADREGSESAQADTESSAARKREGHGADAAERSEAQPPLGRDPDGPAGGLGYAELCVSCDNRTDELRLLGNGVVPATAERAFLTLWEELFQQQPTN